MNILVIGGTGFLGRKCIEGLQWQNKITVVDISENCFENKDITYHKKSLEDIEDIIELIHEEKIDIIMHFVSSLMPNSDVYSYICDMQKVYIPTLRLLDYCSDAGIRFVYVSSGGAIYGNQHEIFNEHTKREPVSYYGLSKLNFENAILFFHNNKNLEYLIIRPSNPYGMGQNIYGKQGLIAVIIGRIISKQSIEIWGDGSAVKDYIYIEDFVGYVRDLISIKHAWNEIYNIGTGFGSSINDVINAFRKNGIDLPKIEYVEEKKSDVKRMILDCTKIQRISSRKCHDLEEGIRLFYNAEKDSMKI